MITTSSAQVMSNCPGRLDLPPGDMDFPMRGKVSGSISTGKPKFGEAR
jgi:hypothetical protein